MYVSEYDPSRVILFAIHLGGPLSDVEVDQIEASIQRAIVDAARQGDLALTNLVIVESRHSPTAMQRKRIGEAVARVTRGHAAFVVRSPILRAVITAIGWFRQGNRDNVQSTHASYEGARSWLVARSGHPASVFDAIERRAREQVERLERAS
jgi:hypothetical protein